MDTASLFDLLETTPQLEREGVWVPIGPASFLIRPVGRINQQYMAYVANAARNSTKDLEKFTEEEAFDFYAKAFAETIILSWKNVKESNGTLWEYSRENAYKLLKRMPRLYHLLDSYATQASTFREKEVEEQVKKS